MMNGNMSIASPAEAKNLCGTLDAGVTYYNNLVSDLKNAKAKIEANWEGDAAAIYDVVTRIEQITAVYEYNLIPAMSGLSTAIFDFATELEKISNNEVENGGTPSQPSTIPNGGNGTPTTTPPPVTNNTQVEEKPSFWQFHGGNFAEAWTSQNWGEAWDYSGCDSGLDYIGTTVDALLDSAGNIVDVVLDTGGAVVNFVVDGASEILGWLFG